MKKDVIILCEKVYATYTQIYTISGYDNKENATRMLLRQGFSYYPSTGMFKKQISKERYDVAKVVEMTY